MQKQRRHNGWLMVETLTAISILVMLAGVLAALMYSAGKGNRMLWARQQAAAAVEAQLDCLSRSGAALPTEAFERLWPDLACTIETAPGDGAAAGLTIAEVTVTGRVKTKIISVTGRRYLNGSER